MAFILASSLIIIFPDKKILFVFLQDKLIRGAK